MSWQAALIFGLVLPLICVWIGTLLPSNKKRRFNRSEVGGIWQINHDWNIRSRH